MKEKIEIESIGRESPKIENLLQLKTLLEKEFGVYSFFLNPVLRHLSGYKSPTAFSVDVEKEERLEKMALENAKMDFNVIEKLNNAFVYRAQTMEQEIEWAKRENNERHLKKCQEILQLFKNKRVVLNNDGTIEFCVSEN